VILKSNLAMALSKQLQRIHEVIMTIKQYGGVFGRNPTFNDVTIEGQLTFDGDIDINSDLKVSGDIETTGNVIIATSGKGIDFSATAGTGTSELLDDYEEGTWTPNQGVGLTVTGAFSSSGTYTKVGRSVTVNGAVSGATSIAGSSGGMICTNLPFTAATGVAYAGSVGVGNVNQGSTLIAFATTIYLATAISATAGINFTVTYEV
jgi:hypothetical protein